jgi:hypothetical protein
MPVAMVKLGRASNLKPCCCVMYIITWLYRGSSSSTTCINGTADSAHVDTSSTSDTTAAATTAAADANTRTATAELSLSSALSAVHAQLLQLVCTADNASSRAGSDADQQYTAAASTIIAEATAALSVGFSLFYPTHHSRVQLLTQLVQCTGAQAHSDTQSLLAQSTALQAALVQRVCRSSVMSELTLSLLLRQQSSAAEHSKLGHVMEQLLVGLSSGTASSSGDSSALQLLLALQQHLVTHWLAAVAHRTDCIKSGAEILDAAAATSAAAAAEEVMLTHSEKVLQRYCTAAAVTAADTQQQLPPQCLAAAVCALCEQLLRVPCAGCRDAALVTRVLPPALALLKALVSLKRTIAVAAEAADSTSAVGGVAAAVGALCGSLACRLVRGPVSAVYPSDTTAVAAAPAAAAAAAAASSRSDSEDLYWQESTVMAAVLTWQGKQYYTTTNSTTAAAVCSSSSSSTISDAPYATSQTTSVEPAVNVSVQLRACVRAVGLEVLQHLLHTAAAVLPESASAVAAAYSQALHSSCYSSSSSSSGSSSNGIAHWHALAGLQGAGAAAEQRVTTAFEALYCTFASMLAEHTANGSNSSSSSSGGSSFSCLLLHCLDVPADAPLLRRSAVVPLLGKVLSNCGSSTSSSSNSSPFNGAVHEAAGRCLQTLCYQLCAAQHSTASEVRSLLTPLMCSYLAPSYEQLRQQCCVM